MVIGSGQLAQVFSSTYINDDVCIFASGVSNSGCTDIHEFERERKMLLSALEKYKKSKFVYFSSCALSAPEYTKNAYYLHKQNMEDLIKGKTNNYYIFRIPQLFGTLKNHKTLINFLYDSIIKEKKFTLYDNAYRYVIEINDTKQLVEAFLKFSKPRVVVNLANDYRYSLIEIVNIFESLLNKEASYELVEKIDSYFLDCSEINSFVKRHHLEIDFSGDYLRDKLHIQLKEKV